MAEDDETVTLASIQQFGPLRTYNFKLKQSVRHLS